MKINKSLIVKMSAVITIIITFIGLLLFLNYQTEQTKKAEQKAKWDKVIKYSNASIVRIEAREDDRRVAYGSGSIVRWDEKTQTAWIATANHILAKENFHTYAKEIAVYDNNGKAIVKLAKDEISETTHFSYKTKIKKELAILKIKLNIHHPYIFKIGAAKYSKVGKFEYGDVKGYPGKAIKLQELKHVDIMDDNGVSPYSKFKHPRVENESNQIETLDDDAYFTTYSMGSGNSGGPVLNSKNELIGVISSANFDEKADSSNPNYPAYETRAVRNEHIKKLLKEMK